MKRLILTLVLFIFLIPFCASPLLAQEILQLTPKLGMELDFSGATKLEWDTINELLNSDRNWEDFTANEIALIQKHDAEVRESMFDIIGGGCSFYCGAGAYTISTTSSLPNSKDNSYVGENLMDNSYETAWVEGVPGTGFGEKIVFHFDPDHPRITQIIIVNGYSKSKTTWENNSRVKRLRMYVNNLPYAYLYLEDFSGDQTFDVKPLGKYVNQANETHPWSITFEILNVYPGLKYEDTAITEIFFDGIDVH